MIAWSTTPRPALAGLAARVWARLSGKDARDARAERDVCEEALRQERRRRLDAEALATSSEKAPRDELGRAPAPSAARPCGCTGGACGVCRGCDCHDLYGMLDREPTSDEVRIYLSARKTASENMRWAERNVQSLLASRAHATARARFLDETRKVTIGHLRAVLDGTAGATGAARTWLYRLAHHADELRGGVGAEDLPAVPPEREGSRGGLAWMPGEHGDEETLPSEGVE